MAQQSSLKPTHLSLFAFARDTGQPIASLPTYAEVAVAMPAPIELPPGEIDERFDEVIDAAINDEDQPCASDAECQHRVAETVRAVLSHMLTQDARDQLNNDARTSRAAIGKVLRTVLENSESDSLGNLSDEMLVKELRNATRSFAQENGLELVPVNTSDVTVIWAYPLGTLATDHAGYLSFDLTRLPADVYDAVTKALDARRRDPNATTPVTIWLYPMARQDLRLDALAQNRFAYDAIVVKLEIDLPGLPDLYKYLGWPTMQQPTLTDWRLSPASFATNPAALVGEDGCETLLPANMALQEFFFNQVVRLNDVRVDLPDNVRDKVRLGVVHEYRLAWYALGHSLGQILYSLPLAPGESVNLAVIDWTRRDDAQRKEQTKLDEQLVHNEHRDRVITETVQAAVNEYQHGSSFMGGLAGSVGLSTVLGGGAGLAAGLTGSLGGSTASSEGSRALSGTTVQKLSDNITQASAAMRELQSTVVVHSVQAEKEAIETRTVVNYNHSHALTILYYEVLRHFRVLTEFVRFRPAILVRVKTDWFTDAEAEQNIRENRAALEAVLLDPKYIEAFNAIERVAHRKRLAPSPAPAPPTRPELKYFTFHMTTGGFFAQGGGEDVDVGASLLKTDGNRLKLMNRAPDTPVLILDHRGSFGEADKVTSFVAMTESGTAVDWSSIDGIVLDINPTRTNVSFARITIVARDTSGADVTLLDRDYKLGHLIATGRIQIMLPLDRPPAISTPLRPPEEVEDDVKVAELLAHLRYHEAHYSRAILLKQDAADRALGLDAIKFPDGSSILDRLENRLLELIGDYLAYPCTDPQWAAAIQQAMQPNQRAQLDMMRMDERLVTLPTRGVFAEAKLGHCNASEEIDNTRFWDWQTSPIPHMAPEIASIQGVTPQSQQQNLTSTPFPQSLVNIVNPPNAPDPTGLSAALSAITTPNIFRDMSGRAEVADLLKKLSDNTIGIAQAANTARAIQAKYGSAATGGGGANPGVGGSRANPTQPSAVTRDLQDARRELQAAQRDGFITPAEGPDLYKRAARLAFGLDAGTASAVGGTGPALDAGGFQEFVDLNRVDIEIADVLRKLGVYPADSWAKQTSVFAHHELKNQNLLAIVKHTNVQKVKDRIPEEFRAEADQVAKEVAPLDYNYNYNAPREDAATVFNIPLQGIHKGYILIGEDKVQAGTVPGRDRMVLAAIIAHELTHFRNREFFLGFYNQTPTAASFVNLTKALANRNVAVAMASEFMGELICRHIEWRVQRDIMIFNQLPGVAPETPDFKGFFQYALKLARRLMLNLDNSYMKSLTSAEFNQQTGVWIRQAGINAIFHDDPVKDAEVKQMFQNTFNAVSPNFDEPNAPLWGQGIDDSLY